MILSPKPHNTDTAYIALLRKYSKAVYSYLTITDFDGHRHRFLANPQKNPEFSYVAVFDRDRLKKRLQKLETDLKRPELNDLSKSYLKRRKSETELLLALIDNDSNKVRQLNASHYGEPSLHLTKQIVGDAMKFLTLNYPEMLLSPVYEELKKLVGFELKPSTISLLDVEEKFFEHYQRLLAKNQAALLGIVAKQPSGPYSSAAVTEVLQQGLEAIGADKLGWRVSANAHLSYVRIGISSKTVGVGKGIVLKNRKSLKQIVLHELGVHVMRSVNGEKSGKVVLQYGTDSSRASEEGLAIFVEQLSRQRLIPLRTFRYLAAAFASGVDGRPRDFKAVFAILWRYIYLVADQDESNAKKRAFHETARIFRGLPANSRGLSYNKDITYLVSNLKIWEHLRARKLSQAQFDAMFKGKVDVIKLLEGH